MRIWRRVNHGMVNLSNNSGSSNVGTGQTFTRDGEAPGPAPEGTTVGARADGPAAGGGDGENRLEMARNDDRDESGILSGEQIGEDGSVAASRLNPAHRSWQILLTAPPSMPLPAR